MLNADTFYDHDADIDCANFEKIWTEVREFFGQYFCLTGAREEAALRMDNLSLWSTGKITILED